MSTAFTQLVVLNLKNPMYKGKYSHGIFCIFRCFGKDYAEAFNFSVLIIKVKTNIKRIWRNNKVVVVVVVFAVSLGHLYLVLLLPTVIWSLKVKPNLCLKHQIAYILWFHFGWIFNVYPITDLFWWNSVWSTLGMIAKRKDFTFLLFLLKWKREIKTR